MAILTCLSKKLLKPDISNWGVHPQAVVTPKIAVCIVGGAEKCFLRKVRQVIGSSKVRRIKSRANLVDLRRAFMPLNLISELTSKCNLRCTYCPKGALDKDVWNATPGRDEHMSGTVLNRYLEAARQYKFGQIQLSGVGEFTFRDDWVEVGENIRDQSGSRITIVSNFSRIFTKEELDFLMSLSHIMVSVDTPDPHLLKKVRKAVDVRTITTNIINLRARSLETDRAMPVIKINGTIYAENLTHIYDLACFAVSVGVPILQLARVSLSDANEFPHPITMASPQDAAEALRQMDLARALCARAKIHYSEFGDLRSELERVAQMKPMEQAA